VAERNREDRLRSFVAPALVGLLAILAGYRLTAPAEPPEVERSFDPATDPPLRGAESAPLGLQPSAAGATAPVRASRRDFVPRDPQEWQGMPVDASRQAFCESESGCGLAMACIAGQCAACSADAECAGGEACVLQHCLRAELASCATRHDCAPGELCILSGYSGGGTRNNERMRSECIPPVGGVAQRAGEHAGAYDAPPEARTPRGPRSPIDLAALQNEIQAPMLPEATEPGPR
jgi:hypothetical protein